MNWLMRQVLLICLNMTSNHGRFAWDIRVNNDLLQVGDDAIRLFPSCRYCRLTLGMS